ncbi:MAG: beta-N-acetylhexosaminidase [Bacteroidetes bacterium]|nr:beta-N-acetylhexosaminidase [Bacteroidota bacterium]
MKIGLSLFAFIFATLTILCQENQKFNIIPHPVEIEKKDGFFDLKSTTTIIPEKNLYLQAKQLKDYLDPATGFNIKIGEADNQTDLIILQLNEKLDYLGDEGYTIEVTQNKILIEAFRSKGIFWAFQTILQLLPNDILRDAKVDNVKWHIPNCSIKDRPRFKWRGLMIDFSRTFWNKRVTKKYIDAMAFYKMNKLHMHLTDDQGWRIEIKKYPKLTEIASKFDTSYHEPEEREGYFSQSDLKEIIAYSQERNIDIVPEIEMPGHASEVFSVYPGLSCKGDTMKIHPFTLGLGIHKEIFCAGNDETFVFLKNVLSEVIEIFPSKYIHIGGDEAPKEHWKECAKCQQRIKENGLQDEHELQSWFIKQIESFLSANGKTLIGWDEIVEGGLSKTATVMYWRTWEEQIPDLVVTRGNNLIMSPTSHCYFDYTYETISSEKVYSYNPVPDNLNDKYRDNILGVQANFWSHLSRNEPEMDRQIFPRIIALAEVGWTMESNKSWVEFNSRLNHHLKYLDILDIYYYDSK